MNTIINLVLLFIFAILVVKNDCQNYYKNNQFQETLCNEKETKNEIIQASSVTQ